MWPEWGRSRHRDRLRVEALGIADEAMASLTSRPARALLSAAGTVLGVGVLISVIGLTATARSQIDTRFDELAATEVIVDQVDDPVTVRSLVFPDDFERRVMRVRGVTSAGLAWEMPPQVAALQMTPVVSDVAAASTAPPVMAVSSGALGVARAHVRTGRLFDAFVDRTSARVAVVSARVADQYGIDDLTSRPAIRVGGVHFTVIGIIDRVQRHPELLGDVMVPTRTARGLWGDPRGAQPPQGWVGVSRGAGTVVARQLPVAISAAKPERFRVTPPPDPRILSGGINRDMSLLFLVLAGVCLVVGMVGIANTTLVTVMERTGEIGLRRALGARPRHIAWQVLGEASLTGLLGGLVGSLLALGTVVLVALTAQWTAVVPPLAVLGGPLVGGVTAVVAAVYPAVRATRIEPLEALRAGTT